MSEAPRSLFQKPPFDNCWFCHGWGNVDKQDTGERAWNDATGGERGIRFPVYRIVPAFGTYEGELIACPFCRGTGKRWNE